jgi:hypothetical protein
MTALAPCDGGRSRRINRFGHFCEAARRDRQLFQELRLVETAKSKRLNTFVNWNTPQSSVICRGDGSAAGLIKTGKSRLAGSPSKGPASTVYKQASDLGFHGQKYQTSLIYTEGHIRCDNLLQPHRQPGKCVAKRQSLSPKGAVSKPDRQQQRELKQQTLFRLLDEQFYWN